MGSIQFVDDDSLQEVTKIMKDKVTFKMSHIIAMQREVNTFQDEETCKIHHHNFIGQADVLSSQETVNMTSMFLDLN